MNTGTSIVAPGGGRHGSDRDDVGRLSGRGPHRQQAEKQRGAERDEAALLHELYPSRHRRVCAAATLAFLQRGSGAVKRRRALVGKLSERALPEHVTDEEGAERLDVLRRLDGLAHGL